MTEANQRVLLAAHPIGEPKASDFAVVEVPAQAAGEGEVGLRTIYLSLDPYMRGRMNPGTSYAPGVALGEVMTGGAVSEVVESRHPDLRPGDIVEGRTGWQSRSVAAPSALRKVDPHLAPISTALGVLGMPGMTAYTGLLDIGTPRPGETVVVAAASGAVGSVVGQIAKLEGARAVGIAGSARKCEHVTDELGFDACIDHRSPDFRDALAAACPDGIDVYFENVGGPVFEAIFPLLEPFARIPVCGLISQYNAVRPPEGPNLVPAMMRSILTNRIAIRGFIVSDFAARAPDFYREMSEWVRSGQVRYLEDVVEGLENAVGAFQGLLRGENFGKLLVRVGPDPSPA